jgi:hypothetical protein
MTRPANPQHAREFKVIVGKGPVTSPRKSGA